VGIPDRQTREKEERKKRIIDAAEDVIFAKGMERATMDEIAETAELSKGTLYYYFKNKHDLYLAINSRGLSILNQILARVITENRSGIELVRRLGEEYINFVREYPDYFNAMMDFESFEAAKDSEELPMLKPCEKKGQEAFTYVVRALQIGMHDGTIDDQYAPQFLAAQLWGNIRGITQLYHIKQKGHYLNSLDGIELDIDEMYEGFLNLFIKGMQTSSSGGGRK